MHYPATDNETYKWFLEEAEGRGGHVSWCIRALFHVYCDCDYLLNEWPKELIGEAIELYYQSSVIDKVSYKIEAIADD